MNYQTAIADFAAVFGNPGHAPQCITARTQANVALYPNNVQENRVAALADAFPTVQALVGAEFFAAMVRMYVAQYPANSANLHDDGADFSDFLIGFAHVQDVPYLPDVARLDLALHRSHYAVDWPALPVQVLSSIAADDFARSVLQLHPATCLVISGMWPIAAILEFHHGGAQPDWEIGGQAVWVWRDRCECIQAAPAACLNCWLQGASVEAGIAAAQAVDAQFDPAPLLLQLFNRQLVIGIKKDSA